MYRINKHEILWEANFDKSLIRYLKIRTNGHKHHTEIIVEILYASIYSRIFVFGVPGQIYYSIQVSTSIPVLNSSQSEAIK